MGLFSFKPAENKAALNPVQDPQILPVSYSVPIVSARFSSPAASAYVPENFFAAVFRKF